MRTDRREIEGLLKSHFPQMVGKSSDEWHAFLNELTGLSVELSEPNGSAFDQWRQALARQGYADVWSYSPERIERIKAKAKEMADAERLRQAAIKERRDAQPV